MQRVDEQREARNRNAGCDQPLADAVDDLLGVGAWPGAVDHPGDEVVDGGLVDDVHCPILLFRRSIARRPSPRAPLRTTWYPAHAAYHGCDRGSQTR